MASSVKATNKMENRDIYWIKEMIENGEIKFNEGVGASDNPIIFRYEEDYIVQADEFLYMDKHLDIRKIDTLKAFSEIEKVCDKLLNLTPFAVDIDKYISLEARMCIDCLFVKDGIDFLEYDDYYIDAEHNFHIAYATPYIIEIGVGYLNYVTYDEDAANAIERVVDLSHPDGRFTVEEYSEMTEEAKKHFNDFSNKYKLSVKNGEIFWDGDLVSNDYLI